jgi:benzoyl-CoA reductase/2-hydroxyglutaryl-CoA dehydratase subunit BcrC/BadD/HgdB
MHSPFAKLAEEGRPAIACLPLYPPEELIDSFGAVPVVLWGLKDLVRRTPEADRHVQNYVCSIVRNIAEFLLTTDPVPAGLFFYNACDAVRNLPEILADGWKARGAAAPAFFDMHIPVQALGREYGEDYLGGEILRLIARFEGFFSADFSPTRFFESVMRYEKVRRLAREAEELVARGAISFSEFSRTIMENTYLLVDDRIARLSALITEHGRDLPRRPEGAKRVVLTGIHPPPPKVTAMIEAAGMTVVGNDIAALARSYGNDPLPTDDPVEYYQRFYREHVPCTTLIASSDRRVEALTRLIEKRYAEGLIIIGEKFCEYEYFEIPHVAKHLAGRGVKTLVLEFSAEDENLGPIETRIEAFGEMM